MLINQLPARKSFIPTTTTFTALFNNPIAGKYSFESNVNKNVLILPVERQSVYVIDKMSVGGNISEVDFNDCITSTPFIRFYLQLGKEQVYPYSIPITNYIDDKDFVLFFNNDKLNNKLIVDFGGELRQNSNLVGKLSISLTVNFSIYRITDPTFVKNYQSSYKENVGDNLR